MALLAVWSHFSRSFGRITWIHLAWIVVYSTQRAHTHALIIFVYLYVLYTETHFGLDSLCRVVCHFHFILCTSIYIYSNVLISALRKASKRKKIQINSNDMRDSVECAYTKCFFFCEITSSMLIYEIENSYIIAQ